MLVFLTINGVDLEYSQAELIELGLALATGKLNYEAVLRWIIEHQV